MNESNRQGKVFEGTTSRLLQTRYHLHHLDNLASSRPDLIPAQDSPSLPRDQPPPGGGEPAGEGI